MLFISGCSTKFVYRNLDWLAYWYLDDFIELTDEQEEIVDVKLNSWLDWHKQNELPQYIKQINEIVSDVRTQQLSLAKIDEHQEKARGHWVRFRDHIVPDLVELSPILDEEQVTYLFAALEKENEKREKELNKISKKDPKKRAAKQLKNNIKQAKDWLGSLTDEQEKLIENTLPQYQPEAMLWLEYRRAYQSALRTLFSNNDRGEEFKLKLNALLLNPEQYRSDELSKRNDHNSEIYKNFLLSLLALSTEKQRERFADGANEYAEDFIDLTKD